MPERDPLARLPHTGPARLPERVLRLERSVRVVAQRTLRPGDACLNQQATLPSMLLVEMMAQVAGLLLAEAGATGRGLLAGIRRMHLHGTARAGETVTVECSLVRRLGDVYRLRCRSRAGRRQLAHGSLDIRRVRGEPV